eukprot:COSAG06_NODE_437_length_15768_cov_156.524156_4_plen_69_part_00
MWWVAAGVAESCCGVLLLLCCVRLDAAELRLDAPVKVCRAEAFSQRCEKSSFMTFLTIILLWTSLQGQ